MDTQIENAIDMAYDPRTDPNIKSQAFEFLAQLRHDPTAWQACLSLFNRNPAPSEPVRLVCLDMVNNAVQTQRLDIATSMYVKENLMAYIHQTCSSPSTTDLGFIQNKLVQTLTYLFTTLYPKEWTSFFDDFRAMAGDASTIGSANPDAAFLYLKIISSIHDEIADQMIPRTAEEQQRSNDLKDLIRARDITKIAQAWQEILSRWGEMDMSIVEMCLRSIAKWVSWIDITIVLDATVQNALLQLAGQQGQLRSDSKEARVRDAAIDTFTETVAKKMPPRDKIELIGYLNLARIVQQLVASPALSQLQHTPEYDVDLAETIAKLVNNVVFDIVKVLDSDGLDNDTTAKANNLLQSFVPHVLRFLADEFDEVCSTVIPSLTDLLTMLRHNVKSKGASPSQYTNMLEPILDAIVAKMKYDETASWGDDDEGTDEAEFQELRKRLHVLQQTVAAVDEELYIRKLVQVIVSTLSRLDDASAQKPDWRDLDLALHEMYLFGELAMKKHGLYAKGQPTSTAAQHLIEMMSKLVTSGLATYPHPAIQLQYMEISVRYVAYFEHDASNITDVLSNFVTFLHSEHLKVRLRSWYLFQRFVRHLRSQLSNMAQTVVQAMGDLLIIKAELPEDKDDDDLSSDANGQSADATFTSQLYLFETIGSVSSTPNVPLETKVSISKSVIEPLTTDLHHHLAAAERGDARSIVQIHHVIMALGTLANGFSDWAPGTTSGSPPPAEISQEFLHASEAVSTALETLKHSSEIRTAARHSFSRFMGVLGNNILSQLARWIDGLLSPASSNDEMAMFLRTLGQVVYGFKTEIFSILDSLLSPLLQRVFGGLAQPITGTDDEVQLRELKQQYLNFVLVILNNDLASVLVSPSNQSMFDPYLDTIKRFSCDTADPQSARLALSALMRMTAVWGGPDIPFGSGNRPVPALPGFDNFIMAQLAPLPWTLLSTPGFNPHDAQMRSVLQEAGMLQWTILRKVGNVYQEQLQTDLRNLGAGPTEIETYMSHIAGDVIAFRKFFAGFVQQAKR